MVNKGIEKRIKKIRLDQRLTQTEFGAQIGVKGNTVTGYENGTRVPSDSVINNICKTFSVNETWLRTGSRDVDEYIPISIRESPLNQLIHEKECNNLEVAFLTAYFELNAHERKEFCKLITRMFPGAISAIVDGDPLAPAPPAPEFQEAVPIDEGDDVEALAAKAANLVRREAIREEKPESLA